MPSVSTPDQDTLRTFPQSVIKYLSIAPRTEVFSCQVNGTPPRDTQSNGVYRFNYDNASGDPDDALIGMTVDIGTALGFRDIGSVRLRKSLDGTHVFIEETAYGKCPISNNYYASIIDEFLPAPKLPRLVGVRNNTPYISSFTEYHDYDLAYSNQNGNIQPQANITKSATSKQSPKPADWCDPITGKRQMVLSSAFSIAFKTSATIASRVWDMKDGTYDSGNANSITPTVSFPPGFRVISLNVIDSSGTEHIHYFPIWAHDDSYPPLISTNDETSAFRITSDERDEGYTMGYEIFGKDNTATLDVLPKGATVCYWEDADFSGEEPPEQYIDSFLGWATDESTIVKLYDRSVMTLNVGGIQKWLSSFDGFAQKINSAVTVNRWFKMANITVDRVIHYVLREYSTALSICNFYPSGVTTTVKAEDIKKSDIWNQCVELAKGYDGQCIADSLNGIWLTKHYSYLEIGERSSVQKIINLNSQDWTDEAGLQIDETYIDEISIVTGTGSYIQNNKNKLAYSKAPGLVPAHGGSDEEAPFQRLIPGTSQDKLNRLTGHHYARVNNKRKAVTLKLIGNMDVFERAWGEPVTLTWMENNIRGISINAQEFLITKISVNHNVEFGQPSKVITLTLEQATIGSPGEIYTPEDSTGAPPATTSTNYPKQDLPSYQPYEWYNTPPSVPTLAAFPTAQSATERFYVLTNTQDQKVEWVEQIASSSGDNLKFIHDPNSPLYLGTGSTVNGWWMTALQFTRVTDVFGSPGITNLTSHPHAFSQSGNATITNLLFTSRVSPNFVLALGFYDIHGNATEWQPYICRTTDGTNWSYDAATLPAKLTVDGGDGGYIIHMSNHVAGKAYLSGFGGLWETLDYGATWNEISATYPSLAANNFNQILHVPYAANLNDNRFYYADDGTVGVVSGDLVDAVTSGNKLFYFDRGTGLSHAIPWPSITRYKCVRMASCDKDPTRLVMLMWSVMDENGDWDGGTVVHGRYQGAYLVTSRNAGKTWKDQGAIEDAYDIHIASNFPNFLYIFGAQAATLTPPFLADGGKAFLTVSKDFGANFTDGTRNMLSLTNSAGIYNICGAY